MTDPADAVKDTAPCIVLVDKEMDPSIKSGDGDLPIVAEFCDAACPRKV